MSKKSIERLEAIAAGRSLTPKQQRRLWARVSAIRHFLIRAGLCTVEEMKALEDELLADIEKTNLKNLRASVGADEEP